MTVKHVTMEEAMMSIQSGMRVWIQGMANTPHGLLDAFAKRCEVLTDISVFHLHLEGPTPWVTESLRDRVRDLSLFIGPNLRQAVNSGLSAYIPIFLSEVPWFIRQPAFRPHVALINVSPPDRHGYVSLGPTIEATLTAIEQADIVIAQINPSVPRVMGDALLSTRTITYAVDYDDPLAVSEPRDSDPLTDAIGRYVSELIPDRATLQLGIGKIPDAVLSQLGNHIDLGVHSEMISDGVRVLAEAGVITGSYKVTDPGQIVAAFALGQQAMYDFMDDNPSVSIRSVEYTNSTAVIRRNPRMMSINSAVEVDLTGQVVAECIGSKMMSGVGGQMDFVRGASLAPEGKSIIALPSETKSGKSRIASVLTPGAAVTTTRNHVQYVVTEYGVAELHGQTLEERARQLISVAHPNHRDELTRAAKQMLPGF